MRRSSVGAHLALAGALTCQLACASRHREHEPTAAGSIAVRASVAGDASRVTVRAGGSGMAKELLRVGSEGLYSGTIPVASGPQALEVLADAGARRVGVATIRLEVALDATAQVEVIFRGGSTPGEPSSVALVAPRTSAVVGEPVRLSLERGGGPTEPPAAATWTVSPPGCGRLSDPSPTAATWRPLAAGTCKVTARVSSRGRADALMVELVGRSTGLSSVYPLAPSPDGRYLVDRRGTPFLVKGEAAWLALVNLTEEEQELYLANRAAKGFNLVEVMLLNHDYTDAPNPVPPANRYGEAPFLRSGDLTTPNDAYFDLAVRFVDRAATHGIVVLLAPTYLGFDGGREGWWGVLNEPGNTRAVAHAFGRYLGRKFAGRQNVVWLAGGDFAPPAGSEGEARHHEILEGIKAAGGTQPWSGHWNFSHGGGLSTDQPSFRRDMDLNGVYRYSEVFQDALRAYDVQPARPVFLLESTYEHEHAGSRDQPFRKAWWWTMLSGGSGVVWGNNFLWMCETARGTYAATYGRIADGVHSSWRAELDSRGTAQAIHLHTLFEALPWWRLVPAEARSGREPLVIDGQGRGGAHIAAAATREGDALVAYVPPLGTSPRTFVVDLSGIRGHARARWFDPASGAFAAIALEPGDRGHQRFTTPRGERSAARDWVLVVDASRPQEALSR